MIKLLTQFYGNCHALKLAVNNKYLKEADSQIILFVVSLPCDDEYKVWPGYDAMADEWCDDVLVMWQSSALAWTGLATTHCHCHCLTVAIVAMAANWA